MNISETQDRTDDMNPEEILPIKTSKKIRFIQNEEGKWIAKILQDDELQTMKKKKEIGIIIVGHIEHTQTQIIEILNSHKTNVIKGEIILTQDLDLQDRLSIQDILEKTMEINKEKPFIITAPLRDDQDITIQQEKRKPYSISNNHHLRTQKSKASKRKYTQRKK